MWPARLRGACGFYSCPHRVPNSHTILLIPRGNASLPRQPPRPTSFRARRPRRAHNALISPCALPYRAARASRSRLCAVQRCGPRCCSAVRFLKRPAPVAHCANRSPDFPCPADCRAPRLLRLRRSRPRAARQRRRNAAARLATLCVSCVLLPFCGLQGCGLRCCAAPLLPKPPAPLARFANRSPDSPPARPRCLAGRPAPRLFRVRRPWPHGVLLRTPLSHRRAPCHIAFLVRLVPVLRPAKMPVVLLRRTTAPQVACAACQHRKLLS